MQSTEIKTESPKLNLTVEVINKIQREFELPYYGKYSDSNYMMIDENENIIDVSLYDFNTGIEIASIDYKRISIVKTTACSKEEFDTAKELVKAKINAL